MPHASLVRPCRPAAPEAPNQPACPGPAAAACVCGMERVGEPAGVADRHVAAPVRRRHRRGHLPGAAVGPLLQFALAGVAATLILSTILSVILDRTGTSEAIRNAQQATRFVAREVIQPNISDSLLDGDPS